MGGGVTSSSRGPELEVESEAHWVHIRWSPQPSKVILGKTNSHLGPKAIQTLLETSAPP